MDAVGLPEVLQLRADGAVVHEDHAVFGAGRLHQLVPLRDPGQTADVRLGQRAAGGGLGFGAEIKSDTQRKEEALITKATHKDLVKFGLIPELVGRLPVVTALESLTKEDLVKIMTEPKNSIIKQYEALFNMDGVELEFEQEALECIAEQSIERKTGARGLRSIIEDVLKEIMFNLPSEKDVTKVTITKECVLNNAQPLFVKNGKKLKNA